MRYDTQSPLDMYTLMRAATVVLASTLRTVELPRGGFLALRARLVKGRLLDDGYKTSLNVPIDADELRKKLVSTMNYKNAGTDQIPYESLKTMFSLLGDRWSYVSRSLSAVLSEQCGHESGST